MPTDSGVATAPEEIGQPDNALIGTIRAPPQPNNNADGQLFAAADALGAPANGLRPTQQVVANGGAPLIRRLSKERVPSMGENAPVVLRRSGSKDLIAAPATNAAVKPVPHRANSPKQPMVNSNDGGGDSPPLPTGGAHAQAQRPTRSTMGNGAMHQNGNAPRRTMSDTDFSSLDPLDPSRSKQNTSAVPFLNQQPVRPPSSDAVDGPSLVMVPQAPTGESNPSSNHQEGAPNGLIPPPVPVPVPSEGGGTAGSNARRPQEQQQKQQQQQQQQTGVV